MVLWGYSGAALELCLSSASLGSWVWCSLVSLPDYSEGEDEADEAEPTRKRCDETHGDSLPPS